MLTATGIGVMILTASITLSTGPITVMPPELDHLRLGMSLKELLTKRPDLKTNEGQPIKDTTGFQLITEDIHHPVWTKGSKAMYGFKKEGLWYIALIGQLAGDGPKRNPQQEFFRDCLKRWGPPTERKVVNSASSNQPEKPSLHPMPIWTTDHVKIYAFSSLSEPRNNSPHAPDRFTAIVFLSQESLLNPAGPRFPENGLPILNGPVIVPADKKTTNRLYQLIGLP